MRRHVAVVNLSFDDMVSLITFGRRDFLVRCSVLGAGRIVAHTLVTFRTGDISIINEVIGGNRRFFGFRIGVDFGGMGR